MKSDHHEALPIIERMVGALASCDILETVSPNILFQSILTKTTSEIKVILVKIEYKIHRKGQISMEKYVRRYVRNETVRRGLRVETDTQREK
jgi:hypothetical protein